MRCSGRLAGVVSDELSNYRDYLDQYRQTLVRKCEGLTPAQLATRSVPPSSMSLLGMVRHLARVEHFWFCRALSSSDGPRIYDDGDAGFADVVATDEAVAEAFAEWRAQVALGDALLDTLVGTDLGREVTFRRGTETATVRDILVHLIEEYARHCGHADLLRECLDGVTGE
ncbi:DinB family protein [Nocardioides sp. zg-536]|uniref:DinB family protein n=1 Tax=Nocardioides faecalis TaxID=2803858 RepID=A0A938Y5Y1_9ACTN|nr:DinB family protein [Nocardioides faecalis]QVI60654.1 DinB family protein [Nocardioides faecalis]